MRSFRILAVAAFAAAVLPGCQSFTESPVGSMLGANPLDLDNPGDNPGSEWEFVGKEGRAGQAIEYEPGSKWFKDIFMSDRARSIERSVGVY